MSFVHLNVHSEYSLLNGAIRIKDVVGKAKEFGMPAVALTDYGNIFSAVEFFLECKNAHIKPIIGCTVFHPSYDDHTLRQMRRGMDHLFQLVLLIQNQTGYHNLCRLITQSYLEGFYYKPRIDSKLLKQYSEGLIALSAGWSGASNHFLFEGNTDKAKQSLLNYAEIFPNRFYIELQDNAVEGQKEINSQLIQLAKELNLPLVATNNCHYLKREEAEAFETLLCVQTGATLHGAHDSLRFSTDQYHFKSIEEMQNDFPNCPEAIHNTLKIADECEFEFDLSTYHFPRFDPPQGLTLDEHLEKEATTGLDNHWPAISKFYEHQASKENTMDQLDLKKIRKKYDERLKTELVTIKEMGFSGYFLIVSDFIRFGKDNGVPVGPGRGSAAGSLVAYCVRITDLDPIPYNLLFERFLNPERISMPDVDVDFCMYGRDKVIDYVSKKYGNVSQIITFGKMKAKAVLRDVGRVMEIPYAEVDKIAKLVPNDLSMTLDKALKQEPRLQELVDGDPQISRLMEISLRLEGLNRHASTHAAGVVMSDKPLTHFLPLYKGSNGDVVTQFDMKYVEKIGLIKFDFLGLKTLTLIQDCLRIIKRTKNIELDMLDIPMDDVHVFQLLSKGDAAGVFQLESSGMKDLLTRMKPNNFEDLIAILALYRPGPLGSGMVDDFINRKQGKTAIQYDLSKLQPILEDTYGVIVYQEQVMQIASLLAGYSLGEADLLRRAMGKKKADEMAQQRVRFLEGAKNKKIPLDKAEKIFDLMAKFAEYGFNKSHSAAYALISYQTAYLKAHHLVEYMAAILSLEMHNTDRILFYTQDLKAHSIEVLPPHVNESFHGFSVVGEKQIRYGLGAVKGVGEGAVEAIIEARQKEKGFQSFFHFCDVIDHSRVNRRVLEALVKSGAFDSFDKRREHLFGAIEPTIQAAIKKRKQAESGQTDLFNLMSAVDSEPVGVKLTQVTQWTENEKLAFEKEALGFFISGHPLDSYKDQIKKVATADTSSCQNMAKETQVVVSGVISQHRVITTKKGKRMAFVTMEDLKGSIECIFFPDSYAKSVTLIEQEFPIVVKGSIDRTDEGCKILVNEAFLLSNFLSEKTQSVHLKIPVDLLSDDNLLRLSNILGDYKGICRGYLHLIETNQTETVLELPSGLDLEKQDIFMAKINTLFKQKVVEYTL